MDGFESQLFSTGRSESLKLIDEGAALTAKLRITFLANFVLRVHYFWVFLNTFLGFLVKFGFVWMGGGSTFEFIEHNVLCIIFLH